MTKELEQAADEWVEKYAFRVPYDGSNEFYDKEADKHGRAGFIAGATSPAAKAYHEAEIIKELQRKIKSRTRYTDCSMPITEGERIEKHGVEEYNKAIEDAIVILAKQLPSPPKTDKQ